METEQLQVRLKPELMIDSADFLEFLKHSLEDVACEVEEPGQPLRIEFLHTKERAQGAGKESRVRLQHRVNLREFLEDMSQSLLETNEVAERPPEPGEQQAQPAAEKPRERLAYERLRKGSQDDKKSDLTLTPTRDHNFLLSDNSNTTPFRCADNAQHNHDKTTKRKEDLQDFKNVKNSSRKLFVDPQ